MLCDNSLIAPSRILQGGVKLRNLKGVGKQHIVGIDYAQPPHPLFRNPRTPYFNVGSCCDRHASVSSSSDS